MLQSQSAVYIGKELHDRYVDFIAESNYFLILESLNSSKEKGANLLGALKQKLHTTAIMHLADLEGAVNSVVTNEESVISISMGVVHNATIYLKTVKNGQVYVSRGSNFGKIIEGDKSASGHIASDDIFIFTTKDFTDFVGSEQNLKMIFNGRKPREIVDTLILQLKERNDEGTIALFVSFNKPATVETGAIATGAVEQKGMPVMTMESLPQIDSQKEVLSSDKKKKKSLPTFSNPLKNIKLPFFKTDRPAPEKRKYVITVVVVAIIALILIWSVGLGYQRRQNEATMQKVNASKQIITQKLDQAQEVAFLNMARALVLLNESHQELDKLKAEVGDKQPKEIAELQKMIADKENQIVKKEDKSYDEFYDLAVDSKDAAGSKVFIDGDTMLILDDKGGRLYSLSLTKKSLNKVSASEIKSAKLIALDGDTEFFFVDGKGIYKIVDDKPKKVIDNDNDWGVIKDMQMYNGNIYLLDSGKSEIYKYVAADDGYGSKGSYFQGGENALSSANSMAIDSSVYVSLSDHILKFTSGSLDEFKTTFPDKDASISKVITTADLTKVYGWDKNKGAIYVMEKTGSYLKQVESSILKKADDVTVFENEAYILSGSKIYKMSLD